MCNQRFGNLPEIQKFTKMNENLETVPTCKSGSDNHNTPSVEFLRALGSQAGVSVWQHTLIS